MISASVKLTNIDFVFKDYEYQQISVEQRDFQSIAAACDRKCFLNLGEKIHVAAFYSIQPLLHLKSIDDENKTEKRKIEKREQLELYFLLEIDIEKFTREKKLLSIFTLLVH